MVSPCGETRLAVILRTNLPMTPRGGAGTDTTIREVAAVLLTGLERRPGRRRTHYDGCRRCTRRHVVRAEVTERMGRGLPLVPPRHRARGPRGSGGAPCGSRAARTSPGRSISTAFAPGASDLEAVKVELRWIRWILGFLAAFVLVQRPSNGPHGPASAPVSRTERRSRGGKSPSMRERGPPRGQMTPLRTGIARRGRRLRASADGRIATWSQLRRPRMTALTIRLRTDDERNAVERLKDATGKGTASRAILRAIREWPDLGRTSSPSNASTSDHAGATVLSPNGNGATSLPDSGSGT